MLCARSRSSALMLLGLFSPLLQANKLTIYTEEYPPYNMMEPTTETVTGVSTDIVRELMRRAKQDHDILLVPWQRAISLAQAQPDSCVYSMSRTEPREALYKWIGPLVQNEWVLFGRVEDDLKLKKLDDAVLYRIGSYQGDAIVQYLQERGFHVDVAINDRLNPSKLAARRIDLWGTGKLIGQYILRQEKVIGIQPVLTFNRTEMYLACNKAMPDKRVEQLNTLLHTLEKDGTISQIYLQYGYQR